MLNSLLMAVFDGVPRERYSGFRRVIKRRVRRKEVRLGSR